MKQQVDKYWLACIRRELHEDIFKEVERTENTALRVIRNPNQSQKQPAPKLIIVVKSNEQAQALKKKCLNLIESTNNSLRSELNDSVYEHYELKYSINIVHSVDDIMLTVSDAQRRYKMNGINIKSKLEELQKNLNSKRKMEHEFYGTEVNKHELNNISVDVEDCITGLDDDKNYIFAESTGKSYRLTYYDGVCRKQISVGNLLIVVNVSGVRIIDTPLRKRRTDRKQALYCLDFAEVGRIFIYPE